MRMGEMMISDINELKQRVEGMLRIAIYKCLNPSYTAYDEEYKRGHFDALKEVAKLLDIDVERIWKEEETDWEKRCEVEKEMRG